MSDRDGYWDSDWDPEVGIDPPNDRDCYCDERYYDYDPPYDTYVVGFSIGRQEYLLLENRQWTGAGIILTTYPKGIFHTDQKCIAERIAAQYQGWVRGVNLKDPSNPMDPVAPVGLKTFNELMQLKQEFLKKEEELKQQAEKKRIEQEKEYEKWCIEQEKEREKERIEQEKRKKEILVISITPVHAHP